MDSDPKIDQWINIVLYNADITNRLDALDALSEIGPSSKRVLDGMLLLLQDSNLFIRRACSATLSNYNSLPTYCSDTLLMYLADRDEIVSTNIVNALCKLENDPLPILLTALDSLLEKTYKNSGDNDHYWHAVRELNKRIRGIGQRIIPMTLERIGDSTTHARSHFVRLLSPYTSDILIALTDLLEDRDWSVREEAVTQICSLGSRAKKVLPSLCRLLENCDHSEFYHQQIINRILGTIDLFGRSTEIAAPSLISVLFFRTFHDTYNAKPPLVRIGPPAVPYLIAELDKDTSGNDLIGHCYIADVLGDIGSPAKPAEVALVSRLRHSRNKVDYPFAKYHYAFALAKIGSESSDALSILTEGLGENGKWVQEASIEAVGSMGPFASSAIPILEKLAATRDYNSQKAQQAIRSIRRIKR